MQHRRRCSPRLVDERSRQPPQLRHPPQLSHAEPGSLQIQLFEPVGYNIAERIRSLNVDELRPIEALQLLHELQQELKRS